MTVRQIYEAIFTEYPKIGFSPAIVAIAVGAAVAASVIFGGISLGKAYFAHTPAASNTHS
jgi:hypothetical protein